MRKLSLRKTKYIKYIHNIFWTFILIIINLSNLGKSNVLSRGLNIILKRFSWVLNIEFSYHSI